MKHEEPYRHERILVRVTDITPDEVPVYEKAFGHIPHWCGKTRKNCTFVLSAQLTSPDVCADAIQALARCPTRGNQGLWISLVTDRYSGGVHLEPYICEFWREIGGTIDFSFTAV